MGMTCNLYRISNDKIKSLNSDPNLVYLYTAYEDDTESYISMNKAASKEKSKQNFIQKLFGLHRKKEDAEPVNVPVITWHEGEHAETSLDKAWNLIHFGLSKSSFEGEWPNCFLFFPENAVFFNGDNGVTCFAYDAEQTAEIDSFLKEFSVNDLLANLNEMSEIQKTDVYLGEYWDSEDEDEVEYVTDAFEELKSFISESNKLGFGVLFYIE